LPLQERSRMILIHGGTILTVADGVIEGGSVLLGDDGKIAEIFANHTDVPEATVVDATGKYVVPGFVDAHTHLGICNLEVGEIGEDENEMTNPSTPACRALDAVYVWDSGFADALVGRCHDRVHGSGQRQRHWRPEHHDEDGRPLYR